MTFELSPDNAERQPTGCLVAVVRVRLELFR